MNPGSISPNLYFRSAARICSMSPTAPEKFRQAISPMMMLGLDCASTAQPKGNTVSRSSGSADIQMNCSRVRGPAGPHCHVERERRLYVVDEQSGIGPQQPRWHGKQVQQLMGHFVQQYGKAKKNKECLERERAQRFWRWEPKVRKNNPNPKRAGGNDRESILDDAPANFEH